MTSQESATGQGSRATKFTPANVQKIKDFAAQGLSREEIAKSLDVTVGSLQVTCSRLGISLRKRHMLNGNPSYSRVMNGNGRHHDIPNHPPMVGHKRPAWQFQVDCNGARRMTDLPFTDSGIAQLALAAAARNLGMGQLLTETAVTAIKKNMVERILRVTAPKAEDA
jgi:ribosomal protein S18 acetylase RimI-like enzyme